MKYLKQINYKKIMPGFISLMIIAGMAIQAFATSVDMAAFVQKDKYMTKYYELDWRIDDIEKSLERMYKFTCTNLPTWAGRVLNSYRGAAPFSWASNSPNTNDQMNVRADLSEEGYLRVNYFPALTWFGNHDKKTIFYSEIPASLCHWNDGIEPALNCMVRFDMYDDFKQPTTAGTANCDGNYSMIMGPFKKFKKYTVYGQRKDQGAIVSFPKFFLGSTSILNTGKVQYAYDSETVPTTWQTDATARLQMSNIEHPQTGYIAYDSPYTTIEEYKTNPYDINKQFVLHSLYFSNAVPTTDFSQYTNIWIKVDNITSSAANLAVGSNINITNWNNNK